jgi:hypothetical protein
MVIEGRLSACPIAKCGNADAPIAADPSWSALRRVKTVMFVSPSA